MQKAAVGAFAAFTIASSVLTTPPPAHAVPFPTQLVAEKVIREGVYGEYEIDLPEQKYDDARSTFKSAKETKTKKGMLRENESMKQAIKETNKQTRNNISHYQSCSN